MPPKPKVIGPSSAPRLTPLQQFCEKWADGCGSAFCDHPGTKRVLFRGQVPCHLLIVGQNPGISENALGKPFKGPAGKLLDRILESALASVQDERQVAHKDPLRVGFCNLVACMTRDEYGQKQDEPDHMQVVACRPRLEEFIKLCCPKLLCCVGKHAEEYLRQGFKDSVKIPAGVKVINITHPAAVLRSDMPEVQKGLACKRMAIAIRIACSKIP